MQEKKKKISKGIIVVITLVIMNIIVFISVFIKYNNNTITTYQDHSSATNNSYTSYKETKPQKKEITVIDFSTMGKEEIRNWFTQNNINGIISDEYSTDIPKGNFVSQSAPANSTVYERDKITVIFSLGKEPTLGEKNALKKAKSYLNSSAFSYKSLVEQLEYSGFSHEEAIYGVENCEADWNEQAAKKAEQYMNFSSFSRDGLIEQLEYEGFTYEQAVYGAKQVGY